MDPAKLIYRSCLAFARKFALVAVLGALALPALAQDNSGTATNAPDAAKAWRDVNRATMEPFPPPEWQTNKPSLDEVKKFYGAAALAGAEKAKDFYTRFPDNSHAPEARAKEFNLIKLAVERYGNESLSDRYVVLQTERLKDPKLGDDDRFTIRMVMVRNLIQRLPEGMDNFLKEVRAMQKDFPKHDEVNELLLMALSAAQGDQAQALAKEIIDSTAPDQVKDQARGMLKKLEAVGKPLDVKFTALDGRPVDVTAMKGKVVLIDFWATWCGPCVAELPHVKAAYDKLHSKGFEIVGISFDQSKAALEKFVKDENMAWPQYFDGEGWKNKFGVEFGINGIPTMWLVDKQGILRDINARDNLEEKASKFLLEQ